MFRLKKNEEKFEVVSPIAGKCLEITEVNDDVFSKKMLGDGFAIKITDNASKIVSPISGKVILLPKTNHAIGLKSTIHKDIEVLVHIGIDTVNLQGRGFTPQVKVGQLVKAGEPLMEFDPLIMKQSRLDMTTMVIFTSGYDSEIDLGDKLHQTVKAGTFILVEE